MSRRTALSALICLSVLPGLGCFRTVYVNLQPRGPVPHHLPAESEPVKSEGWHHYYVFGVAPDDMEIRAPEACGGLAHVDRLETERNGIQGFVGVLSLARSVYSPYSGRVVCDHGPSFARMLRPPIEEIFPTEFSVSRDYATAYDDVWSAAIRAITESGLVITRADRDAGILIVPRVPFDDTQSYAIPLGHTLGAPHKVLRREGRLVMSVRPTVYGQSRVAIDVAMRVRIRTGNRDRYVPPRYEWREVRSNLSIERGLLDRIQEQVTELRNDVAGH